MFLTFEEYKAMSGSLSESDFNRLSYRAEQTLNFHTFGRIKVPDNRVRRCMFDLIDCESEKEKNAGVKSVSNDGYSVTYQSTQEATEAEYDIIYRYFASTDILYQGVDGIGEYEPESEDGYDYLMVKVASESEDYDRLKVVKNA
ncbi:MAG: hypothetical protein MR019_04375 [Ruminococcus sp.]|nr:hypothetical protein [Ruminococcus sp.]MDY3896215.1 hypothetical protein [Candidatus Fimenecus sp.]